MEKIKEMIHEMIQKLDLNVSGEDKKKYEEMMVKIFIDQAKPQEVLGFSDEMMEHIYAYGYRLYNLGSYKKASEVFQGLTTYNPQESRYALALGASYHRQKNHRDASRYYLRAGVLDPKDPLPFYYLYDCYTQCGLLGDAYICLQEVIDRAGNNPLYEKIKERCILLQSSLKEEIKKLSKEGEIGIITEEEFIEEEIPQQLKPLVDEEVKKVAKSNERVAKDVR